MTRANVNQRLDLAVTRAAKTHPSLTKRSISPRIAFRHTTAMHLLQSGVDFSVIALCLGHEREHHAPIRRGRSGNEG